MSIAHQYRTVPYVDGGRTRAGADCWGLVRMVLLEQYGVPWLAEWGNVFDGMSEEIHAAYQSSLKKFHRVEIPEAGDVVCVFNAEGLCAHVGVVIPGDTSHVVMDTRPDKGVRTSSIQRFSRSYEHRIEFRRYAYD